MEASKRRIRNTARTAKVVRHRLKIFLFLTFVWTTGVTIESNFIFCLFDVPYSKFPLCFKPIGVQNPLNVVNSQVKHFSTAHAQYHVYVSILFPSVFLSLLYEAISVFSKN